MLKKQTVNFLAICDEAGFPAGPDGKVNLPATQKAVSALQAASLVVTGTMEWVPGDDQLDLTITGPGPVWAYLAVAHALHGRVVRLTYASPNATLEIWSHGVK